MAMAAPDQVGELCIPVLPSPAWRWLVRRTARSGRRRLPCTRRLHWAACRAKHRRSTRNRRSPPRPVHTPAPYRGSSQYEPTHCCRWHSGSNRRPRRPTARWPAVEKEKVARRVAAGAQVVAMGVAVVAMGVAWAGRRHSNPCSHSHHFRSRRMCSKSVCSRSRSSVVYTERRRVIRPVQTWAHQLPPTAYPAQKGCYPHMQPHSHR